MSSLATLAEIVVPAAVIAGAILSAEKISEARQIVGCDIPSGNSTADVTPPPFPTYEPSTERPFIVGVETDICQALRNLAADVDPIAPEAVQRIKARIDDELAARRSQR